MRFLRFVASSVVLLALGYSLPGTVAARQWRMTPFDQVLDYTQIFDVRSKSEIVIVMWVVPELLDGDSPDRERARSILREYMLVGVTHVRVSPAGQFTFERPAGILIQTADGKARQPFVDRAIPPAVTGIISTLQATFSQVMGQFSEGVQWYAFDSKGIGSCQKGAVWVYYAREQYGYATPVPGCRQTTARSPGR